MIRSPHPVMRKKSRRQSLSFRKRERAVAEVMAKRKRPLDQDAIPLQKRKRVSEATGLAQLSDEIVLKILTNLGISDLAALQW